MGFPERATNSGSKYPHCPRDTIGRGHWGAWRAPAGQSLGLWACLVLTALAACQTTTPVIPLETSRAEPGADAGSAVAATVLPDIADLLVSESCEREHDHLCAVEALARFLERLPGSQPSAGRISGALGARHEASGHPSRQVLHDRLWRMTAAVSPAQAAVLAEGKSLAPLWQLRRDMSASQSRHEQALGLSAWMLRWPGHPFVEVPPGSLARLLQPMREPARVGLLVPLSGPLAAAGRAVRDGFIAAYFHDSAPLKPTLRVYDAASSPIPTLYEQSLNDDIDFIVGPLSKRRLEALHRLNPKIPVLGLNYLDSGSGAVLTTRPEAGRNPPPSMQEAQQPDAQARKPFMQLGLAIEDEAATIIDRLLGEDLERLLVIHSTEDWAVRGLGALTETWPLSMDTQAFADVKTITESVGEGMQVAASLERRDALERLLGSKLEFQPRARSDLDGVVAFVNHIEAAALAPALKYHYADHLPVYASSQSVRDPAALDELSGFQVTQMPFNLQSEPLWNTVKQAFGGGRGGGNVAALQALGIDAYRLVDLSGWVADGEPVYGATGKLQLAGDGRIHRMLAWGTVSRGAIHPAGEVSLP